MTHFIGAVNVPDAHERVLSILTNGVVDIKEDLHSALETTASVLNDMMPEELKIKKLSYFITPSEQGGNLNIRLNITTRKVEDFKESFKTTIPVSEDGSFDRDYLTMFILSAYQEIVNLRCSVYNAELVTEMFKEISGESGINLSFVVSTEKAPCDIVSIGEDYCVLAVKDFTKETLEGTELDTIYSASLKDVSEESSYESHLFNTIIEDFNNAENIVDYLSNFKDYLHPFLASKTGKIAVNNAKGYFLRSYKAKLDWLEKVKSVGKTAKIEEVKEGDEVVETRITLFERKEKGGEIEQVLPTFIAETKLFA